MTHGDSGPASDEKIDLARQCTITSNQPPAQGLYMALAHCPSTTQPAMHAQTAALRCTVMIQFHPQTSLTQQMNETQHTAFKTSSGRTQRFER
jgi:hypothetical protein